MKRVILLFISLLLLAMAVLGGCSGKTDDQAASTPAESEKPSEGEAPEETQAPEEEKLVYKQSPFLDGKNLPPVEERLPEEPKFTNEMPPDMLDYEIGKYGGTIRTVTTVIGWDADVFVFNNEPLLNTPAILGDEVTGNVLKDYEVSEDQKEFTFYMRKGLKWSDGEPVTMEDFRFTFEDVLYNEELTPAFPLWLRSGGVSDGTPVVFEPVDDWTFKLKFDQPYGGILMRIAIEGWRGYHELLKPAHYLKQFHKKYANEEELEAKIAEAGFQPGEWANLFHDKDIANNEMCQDKAIGFPRLYPWLLTKVEDQKSYYERNPYYFKIDKEGNQLPYIDTIESSLVQDMEMVGVKTVAGEVDFSRESASLVKMPLYKENEERGGYKVLLANMHVTPVNIFLNLNYEDPVWRQVVQDIRFRKALNMAINRQEIIDAVYFGYAEPPTMMDSTFDLEAANKLLDEMGMQKGPDGFRLGPDGKKFSIPFEVGGQVPDIVPVTELIVEMWKELGLDVSMKQIDGALWGTRNSANELKATVIFSPTPQWYRPDAYTSHWARLWHSWITTGGKQGEEPPEEVKTLYSIINEMSVNPPAIGKEAMERVKQEMGKHLWFFVTVDNVKQPLIVNAKMGNVSDKGFAIATNFAGEQLFYRE
ncbi:MAG: ABC transporter substrate-binding protein [Clostridia bacterium]|jgi:peptide/nickel transport system substrate-binding protein